MPESRSRLGKGLGALLGDILEETEARGDQPVREVDVSAVRSNPFQPRREFDETTLGELEASIRENGLLQPIVVRPAGRGYELVAGERRLRALQRLEWTQAPAIVRELSDEQMLLLALVENLQREGLNPIEEAVAYQQLIDGFGLTQSRVARRVGRNRSTVANSLRLLTLPGEVRELLASGAMSAGHARAVLAVDDEEARLRLAREIVASDLSVRDAERKARAMKDGTGRKGARKGRGEAGRADPVARRAETLLSRALGTGVRVRLRGRESGEVRVPFHDAEEFERIVRAVLDEEASRELFGDAGDA
ncbi:MAG: ParB/RepB/Spo0J family partition protein [Gemmatimonadota bacterium]|nr:ParB/RepB/Spo0J family partition protein [Gemmatimonadota bacterium]